MKNACLPALLALICTAMCAPVSAQGSEAAPSSASARPGVPIEQLVSVIARKTGKRFVLDPRVHADVVLAGTTPAELTYPDFLTVLYIYGYAAVEDGKLVEIVPDANIRQQAIPTITAADTRPGSEYVCQVVTTRHVSAGQLVPILRPMVIQAGHLAGYPQSNTLILCDRFENVRRLEGIIRSLDTTETAKGRPTEDSAPAAGH